MDRTTQSTAETADSADGVRRGELAGFLRSRRERIRPEEVGLPGGGRRRTPGLRREEVAALADVGVTWYTWLEQGRDIIASEQVLTAVARTLRLDAYERVHLFRLGRPPERPVRASAERIPDTVRAVLAKLEPYPVVVHDARSDILDVNRGYDWLMDVAAVPASERNALLLAATNEQWQSRMPHWADRLPMAVAEFRAQMAEHLHEPRWASLVDVLHRRSPTFRTLWQQHDVRPMRGRTKHIDHPDAGCLTFDFTHLWFGQNSDVRVTTYTPADDETAAALDRHVGSRPAGSGPASADATTGQDTPDAGRV